MPKRRRRAVVSLLGIIALSACDKAERWLPQASAPTYSGCLQSAVASSSHLSPDDIRALCAEAANVVEPSYDFKDNKVLPNNEFTRCYDNEKKELEAKGIAQADRLAKLSCKYPEMK